MNLSLNQPRDSIILRKIQEYGIFTLASNFRWQKGTEQREIQREKESKLQNVTFYHTRFICNPCSFQTFLTLHLASDLKGIMYKILHLWFKNLYIIIKGVLFQISESAETPMDSPCANNKTSRNTLSRAD